MAQQDATIAVHAVKIQSLEENFEKEIRELNEKIEKLNKIYLYFKLISVGVIGIASSYAPAGFDLLVAILGKL